jgi:hypothetical protein
MAATKVSSTSKTRRPSSTKVALLDEIACKARKACPTRRREVVSIMYKNIAATLQGVERARREGIGRVEERAKSAAPSLTPIKFRTDAEDRRVRSADLEDSTSSSPSRSGYARAARRRPSGKPDGLLEHRLRRSVAFGLRPSGAEGARPSEAEGTHPVVARRVNSIGQKRVPR